MMTIVVCLLLVCLVIVQRARAQVEKGEALINKIVLCFEMVCVYLIFYVVLPRVLGNIFIVYILHENYVFTNHQF
jgi:hypothetical protein